MSNTELINRIAIAKSKLKNLLEWKSISEAYIILDKLLCDLYSENEKAL